MLHLMVGISGDHQLFGFIICELQTFVQSFMPIRALDRSENFDLLEVLHKKSRDHQRHQDSSSGDYEWLENGATQLSPTARMTKNNPKSMDLDKNHYVCILGMNGCECVS